MAWPWLRILDTALELTDLARSLRRRPGTALVASADAETGVERMSGGLETRLVGAVVGSLKQALDRDRQRLVLEREVREAERRRADRLLRLELARQAGEREIGRLRSIAGGAVAGWLATVLSAVLIRPAAGARIGLAVGLLLLVASCATALVTQSQVASALARFPDTPGDPPPPSSGPAGAAALWLLVAGFAVISVVSMMMMLG